MTFNDCRIIASSIDGVMYHATFIDNLSGQTKTIPNLVSAHLGMIVAINLDMDGEPEGYKQFYQELEPLFVDWPNELRPIP